jgi:hypothetical protein
MEVSGFEVSYRLKFSNLHVNEVWVKVAVELDDRKNDTASKFLELRLRYKALKDQVILKHTSKLLAITKQTSVWQSIISSLQLYFEPFIRSLFWLIIVKLVLPVMNNLRHNIYDGKIKDLRLNTLRIVVIKLKGAVFTLQFNPIVAIEVASFNSHHTYYLAKRGISC